MKKLLTICAVVVLAMASAASASFVDTVGDSITFDGVVELDFVNWPNSSYAPTSAASYAATQEGTFTTTEAGFTDYTLVLSSTTSGTAGALVVDISWAIKDGANTSVLNGTMLNFGFADSVGNPIAPPGGLTGHINTLADYATSGAWQGKGLSDGNWTGEYWTQPTWTGSVVITPSAVPEPATMCLLGLGGLLLRRRKSA